MKAKGFTLLELLVAISIFSLIGLGSYQMLHTVSESHDRVRSSVDSYTKVNFALSIIQRDFNQFIARPVRDEYGEPLSPIMFEHEDYLVEFTRMGWANPAGRARSNLQRVAYSLDYEEKELVRHFWRVLDRAEDSEPVSQVLLVGVTDFRVSGFAGDSSEDEFSLEDSGDAAPLAVEVAIETESLGEVERMFQLVDPYLPQQSSAESNADDPNQSPISTPEAENQE
ncbi:MAG: type II secretion system minor pseudopilin GspJ [Gammaproteobacteria bacterium]|jgi:general secretion pathway protein J|nr:type II secretion system minor pseudopilin GspJ [Gammaproteobacteria bacterium]MBT4493279.1 type II secretion system minor pseudopilin GspJ [Gammaproteobacteria bacterium]MBT7372035.1 type II secretion system minor pseudopilin GspJ [Gammaproteobacteria bacterium]